MLHTSKAALGAAPAIAPTLGFWALTPISRVAGRLSSTSLNWSDTAMVSPKESYRSARIILLLGPPRCRQPLRHLGALALQYESINPPQMTHDRKNAHGPDPAGHPPPCVTLPTKLNSPSRRSIGDATLAGRNRKAQQRPIFIAGAFFVPAMSCYGGGARDTFGCAGLLSSRSANPRTAATSTCLAASGGSSTTKGTHACPPIPHPGSPHPLPTAG